MYEYVCDLSSVFLLGLLVLCMFAFTLPWKELPVGSGKVVYSFVEMASPMQRGKQICNVNDVTPTKQNWKVLIQVLEKKKGATSRSAINPTQYRNYLFVDTMGTLVTAVAFGTDVAYFETSLLPYKRYYISNVFVKPVRPGYEVGDYKFSWNLHNISVVQPLEESVPPAIPYDFQFKKFSEMFRYADCEIPINIRGFVVEAFAEKKVGEDQNGRELVAQDFIVVDSENTPVIMRLWKDKLREYADVLSYGLHEGVTFLAMNMKVTTFNGLSLASRMNSVFLREPLIDEASGLKEWYVSNKKEVERLVLGMAYKDTSKLFPRPSPTYIMPVQPTMERLETIKTAWISGRLSLIPGQTKFWYMSCKNCQRGFRQGHDNDPPCRSCGEPNPVTFKCHIGLVITDKSGIAYVEVYSPDVEQLIPFTVERFQKAEEEGKSVVPELEASLEDKHVVCFVRYYDKFVRGVMTRKYPLTKIYSYDDVFPDDDVVSKDSKMAEATQNKSICEDAIDLTRDEDDVHFFTPSTKKVIEEISTATMVNTENQGGASGCKRVLAFDDAKKGTAIVKIEHVDDDAPLQSYVDISTFEESPVKKSKGKMKQH